MRIILQGDGSAIGKEYIHRKIDTLSGVRLKVMDTRTGSIVYAPRIRSEGDQ